MKTMWPGCRIRKLLPDAAPTLFDDYPSYLIPSAKKPRKDPAARASPLPQTSRKRKAETNEPDLDGVTSQDAFSEEEVVSVCTQAMNSDAHRAGRYLSMIGRLRSQVSYHRSKSEKVKQLLKEEEKVSEYYRESKHHACVKKITADAQKGEKKAVFLLHQIECYGKKHAAYPEEVVRECVIWRFLSPRGYDHARTSGLLTLPAKCTLQRYIDPSPTSSGMSNAMKERLVHEASLLSSKQHMASLIIDEASIKQKCIYDRKADAVFGLKDKPESSMANTAKEALANRVLCFVLHGTTSRYKIPCSYYFTKQLSGRDLFAWTKEVIAAVESCGFIIVRIVTDNYSANVTMFKHMAVEHLQQNSTGDARDFKEAGSTVFFMKSVKKWFDIHDTSFNGSGHKAPIFRSDDDRLLWLKNEFISYVEKIQKSIGSIWSPEDQMLSISHLPNCGGMDLRGYLKAPNTGHSKLE
ncbi:hypothetical protein MTO96_052284 [Rhipicephalus appendiculatus]